MSRAFELKTGTPKNQKAHKGTFIMASTFAAALMMSSFGMPSAGNAETTPLPPLVQHVSSAPVEPIEDRLITVTAEVTYDYDMIEPETAALTSFTLPVYFGDGDDRLSQEAEVAIAAFADEALMNGAMHMSVSSNTAPRTGATQMLASARAENILASLTELGMPERLLALDDFHSDVPVVTASLN